MFRIKNYRILKKILPKILKIQTVYFLHTTDDIHDIIRAVPRGNAGDQIGGGTRWERYFI